MYQNRILRMILDKNDFTYGDYINKTKNYIFDDSHREFFELIYDYHTKYGAIPTTDYLDSFFSLEKESNARTIYDEILEIDTSNIADDVSSYVDIQVNYNTRIKVSNVLIKGEDKIKTISTKNLRSTIQDITSEVSLIMRDVEANERVSITLHGEEAKKQLINDYENKVTYLCDYGISSIDKAVGGIFKDDFIQIAGFSGQGKSTLLRQIAYNASMQGLNVFFTTLEMTAITNQHHFTVLHANNVNVFGYNNPKIHYRKIKNKQLDDKEKDFYFNVASDDFYNNENYGNIHINQPPSRYTIMDMHNDILHIHKNVFPVDIVVTDYLVPHVKPIIVGNRSVDREDLNEMITDHRQFLLHNGMAGVNAAQINRAGFDSAVKNKGHLYNPTVLSDYNRLERDATMIWSVFQSVEMVKSKEIQIQHLKGRETGICSTIRLIRDGDTGQHYENRIPTNDEAANLLGTIEI